jgi:hypothetical protein
MLRRFLLGIMVVSFAATAWANVPDPAECVIEIDASAVGASIFSLPLGTGKPFTEARASGGALVDATITLTVNDGFGDPIFAYSFEDMWLESELGGLKYCPGGTQPSGSTDINGQTTWEDPMQAGGFTASGENAVIMIGGQPVPAAVQLRFNSADISGDLLVNLTDIQAFAPALQPGGYNYRADFDHNLVINLTDVQLLASGVGTSCP